MNTRRLAFLAGACLMAVAPAAPAAASAARPPTSAAGPASAAGTTTPIKHFIFLMQGGRTFDNYFGTYPGADGLPPAICQPRLLNSPGSGCVKPFPLAGQQPPPLGASKATIDRQYNRGRMNGFVSAYTRQDRDGASVMGYYDRRELPFYWNVASRYVLFDHFFSSTLYGVRANRSYWVSAATAPGGTGPVPARGYGKQPTIFDRLQAAGVSWKFYIQHYNPAQTYQTVSPSNPETQTARAPLVDYRRFTHNPVLKRHLVGLDQFFRDLARGTLPAVAYIASSPGDNERSARTIAAGQSLVRDLITQLMMSRYWDSSALMWSYDSSGGWFDHVRPPRAGSVALGLRVPALLVSAYARKGQVNHTVLDFTSALKFIEQNWRLAPLTSRDATAHSLASAFDFGAGPRPPVLIPGGQAGPGSTPAVAQPGSPTSSGTVYWLYGTAAAVSVLLVIVAGAARLKARREGAGPGARTHGASP